MCHLCQGHISTATDQSAKSTSKPAFQGYHLQQADIPEDTKGIKVCINSKVVNLFLQLL